jgi:hypothetical protein
LNRMTSWMPKPSWVLFGCSKKITDNHERRFPGSVELTSS